MVARPWRKRPNLPWFLPILSLLVAVTSTAALAADTSPQPAQSGPPSLVVNGNFEIPAIGSPWLALFPPRFYGWNIDEGSVDIVRSLYRPAGGQQSLDMDGNCCEPGQISQVISTQAGASYLLSFALAGNPDTDPVCGNPHVTELEVFWGSSSLGVFSFDTTGHTNANPGWQAISLPPVTANSTSTNLKFASLTPGACGPALDKVLLLPASVTAAIDIRPGSTANIINPGGLGTVTVAILSTANLSFDASDVIANSVCFGDAEDPSQADCTEVHGQRHLLDVNGDGRRDLVLHFETAQTGIDAGDTQACLRGRNVYGQEFRGCDSITT
jgi:hypothetical protein